MRIDLKALSFGAPAAERDDNLAEYFIERESFKRLRDGEKTVALGTRGSGKTAIFRMLAEQCKKQGTIVIELAHEHYSYELLSNSMVPESEGSYAKQGAYTSAWKYVIYVHAMKAITDQQRRLKSGSAAKVYEYLRDNHANIDKNPIGTLISYLKRIEGIKVGKFEAGLRARQLQKLYKLEEIERLLEPLRSMVGKQKVLVLVDELDRGWDASEDARAFVAGLFHAAQSVNQEMPGLRVLLSLRRELYNSIPSLYEDAQKVTDIIEVIEWDEESLLDLITRRIAISSGNGRESSRRELWNLVFAETLDYRQTKSFNYLIDRTLYRPREIIQFSDTIREKALSGGHAPPLNYGIISEAEMTYSELRLKDIAAEHRFEFPGLEQVFQTFRGLPYTFDREGLDWHCLRIIEGDLNVGAADQWCKELDPDSLVQVLWQTGFLRAQTVGGLKAKQRSGSSYLGPHQIGSLSLINLSRFHVHQMFRPYLSMKQGTYTP